MINTKYAGRKRVVCLFNSFVSISGGDIRFIEIFKRIKDLDKVVITPVLGRKLCEMKKLDAAYFQTTQETHFKNISLTYFTRILKALFLKKKINNEDILYSTSDFLPDVLPAFLYKRKNKNVKWVQVIHHLYENPFIRVGNSFLANLFGFLSQRLSFALIRRGADSIIIVNPNVRRQLSRMGFDEKEICVNYNGVDLKKIQSFQPSIKKYDCVFLGRLNVSKGIFDLVEIWKNVITKNPYATLAIIGGGDKPLEQKLGKIISENKLERNVDVLGYLEDEEAFPILKSSKIFVFPGYEEGWGIAIAEAMACDLPVVAYNLSVYKEVFEDKLLTVPVGDVDAMAKQVIFLLENTNVARKIGEEGRDFVKRYDWKTVAERELMEIKRARGGTNNELVS